MTLNPWRASLADFAGCSACSWVSIVLPQDHLSSLSCPRQAPFLFLCPVEFVPEYVLFMRISGKFSIRSLDSWQINTGIGFRVPRERLAAWQGGCSSVKRLLLTLPEARVVSSEFPSKLFLTLPGEPHRCAEKWWPTHC